MIPILYDSSETTFTSNGLGRLVDCTSCKVAEVRNGEYECEFKYPIAGKLYDQIKKGRIISCTHDDHGDRQPFIIYRESNPDLKGIVTFNAHHYTYLLNNIIMPPFTAQSAGAAFTLFETQTVNTNPFTFWTDNTTAGTAKSDVPIAVRAALGGTDGSVLDAFHGEYEWDVMQVKLHAQRGIDSGVTIRYGKNLTDLKQTKDGLGTYNAAVGYWLGDVNGAQTLVQTGIIRASGITATAIPVVLDMSSEFDNPPSVNQLETKVRAYLNDNAPWVPKENFKINFVQLWQTEEFKDVAELQRLSLCDRVNVYYPALGVEVSNVEIIKVVYNVLLDRYDEMELGDPTSTLAQTLVKPYQDEVKRAMKNAVTQSAMQAAIDHATQLITGGTGGTFKWVFNADGEPVELLILDTGDESTAVNVWRWNAAGLGHSSNGVDGPYADVAITMDGQISASAITTGTLLASLIKGGTFKVGGGSNGNGTIQIYDANNNLIGTLDNTGADLTGNITMRSGLITVNAGTSFTYYNGTVDGRLYRRQTNGMRAFLTDSPYNYQTSVTPSAARTTQWLNTTNPTGFDKAYGDLGENLAQCTFLDSKFSLFRESNSVKGHLWSLQNGQLVSEMPKDDTNQAIQWSSNTYRDKVLYLGQDAFALFTYLEHQLYSQYSKYDIGEWVNNNQGSPANYNQRYVGIGKIETGTSGTKFKFILNNQVFAVDVNANVMEFSSSGLSVLGHMVAYQSSSSRRYKHDIKAIKDKKLDPHRLYDLPVRQFEYNEDATLQYADMEGQTLPGFIAEEVAAVYPSAVIRDENGKIESWDERRILPGMLALIQEQKQKIDSLEARIEKLESLVNSMIGD